MGVYDLRLSDERFWKLTPLLFDALLKRKQAEVKREDIRAGIVASTVVNFSIRKIEKPMEPLDFFPQYNDDAPKKDFDLRDLPPEEQAEYIRNQFRKKIFVRK